MKLWLIVSIIICCIVGIIILNNVFIVIYLIKKGKKIKNREHELYSMIAQQHDITNLLIKMLLEKGVAVPQELRLNYDVHTENKKMSTIEQYNLKVSILKILNHLIIIGDNSILKDDEKYKSLKFSLDDFNLKYRKEVVLLNQDIYAYNYWVCFFFFRPISFIFHLKKKEFIQ